MAIPAFPKPLALLLICLALSCLCLPEARKTYLTGSWQVKINYCPKQEMNELVLNNGAEFIVAIAGNIMRMRGLPKEPQAVNIDLVDGEIVGLS